MDASEQKLGSRPLKAWKRIVIALAVVAAILAAVFLAGRYGWKLLGFRACQGAGIEAVEVSEDKVHISGFYPGPFPEGFCGCYSEERDGTTYFPFPCPMTAPAAAGFARTAALGRAANTFFWTTIL